MRRSHIERLLPANFQRAATPGSVLSALLAVMETLHAPTEATLAAVDDLAAPYRTPDVLVPFLVRWVGWDHVTAPDGPGSASSAVPVGRLRDLVAKGAELAARRGTATGLCDLLSTVCGVAGFAVDEPVERPFHIVVRVPPEARDQLPLIRRVVQVEKPAAATCEVIVDPAATTQQPNATTVI
jgi:phage tail-like protein